jgi:hypothetical protein
MALSYKKYGTRLAVTDEGDQGLQDFALSGTKAMIEGTDWHLLEGPVERLPVGSHDGDEVVAYLWPIARQE